MNKLQETVGGAIVNSRDFIEGSSERHPLALEEALHNRVIAALAFAERVGAHPARQRDLTLRDATLGE